MDAAGMRKHDVSRPDWPRGAGCIQNVLAPTGQDGPGILTMGMRVGGDSLARVDVPGDNHGFLRLSDDGADGLTRCGLEKGGTVEDALRVHCRP